MLAASPLFAKLAAVLQALACERRSDVCAVLDFHAIRRCLVRNGSTKRSSTVDAELITVLQRLCVLAKTTAGGVVDITSVAGAIRAVAALCVNQVCVVRHV